MRMIVIGYPSPNPAIDNYNPFNAPSYFDYDVLVVDPAAVTRVAGDLLRDGTEFEAQDGRPVLNTATTATAVSAADMLRRREDETQRFLEQGGTVIVFARPNVQQAGILGFEGLDRYHWLPAPAGMSWSTPYLRAAEGKTVRITSEGHPFSTILRDFRPQIGYRAVFDDRLHAVRQSGRVIATGGSGAPIAMEFDVLGGQVVFLPAMTDDIGTFRAEFAQKLVDAAGQYSRLVLPPSPPYWARTYPVPGLEQAEAEIAAAEEAAAAAAARVDAARELGEALAAHRRLLTDDGRSLATAVRVALELIGFTVVSYEGQGLVIENEGHLAFVECEGARDEVVEWPYVRLQRRLEERLLKQGDAPKGIVIVNGRRTSSPEERAEPEFTTALRVACENYRYALLTTRSLFAALERALGGAGDDELGAMRRRLINGNGLLETAVALGDAPDSQDNGSIF